MKQNNRKVGSAYEQAIGQFLKEQGYQILEYNYRCRKGEIDIIARDGEYLVFCEVKFRKNASKGNPLEAVGNSKQKIIGKCALYYMMTHGMMYMPCRFDVIGVLDRDIFLVKNAFSYIGSY